MISARAWLKSRWTVVFGGFLIALMGGLSYSWGVFVEPMQRSFDWSKSDATLPLSVFMAVFALMMIPGGRLQESLGFKRQIRLGAVLFLLAGLLSSLVVLLPNKWWLVFSYGVIGGTACGISYACIAPPIRRWFPDHPGLAVSLGVMGFGLASFFFAPLKARILLPHADIHGTFILIGLITGGVTWLASYLVKSPDDEWYIHLFGAMHLSGHTSSVLEDVEPRRMLREGLFWLTWLSFLCVVYGSLLIIGILPSFGVAVLKLNPAQAAIPVSLFALSNGLSRPLAGWISDRVGSLKLMISVYLVQTALFFILPFHVSLLAHLNLTAVFLGIGIGVTLALYPVLSSEFWGVRHLGQNFGILFSAYGFSALAMVMGARLHDLTGSYTPALLLAGTLSSLGTLLLIAIQLFLRKRPH